jgi:glycosyltransferase involved in cell wall biosynthesis
MEGAYGEQRREDLPNVEHRPTTAEMGRVYGETRVLVLPSAEESFGMVGVEAQLGGVPVIASDLPSLRESLGDGALFVPREDLGAWVDALRRLDDAASYEDVSRRARENVARFDVGRDVAVLDEAQNIKNAASRTARAARA